MTYDSRKAKALGAFLRSRRERLSPEEAGVRFSNGSRKTPGLRREEVAVLAGVSVTYYTWLEQGRDVTPSFDIIESIAIALKLSSDEKSHLFDLWNTNSSKTTSVSVVPGVEYFQLQRIIEQLKYPSYITNEKTEILGWNQAAIEMVADFSSWPANDRYFIKLFFKDEEIRRRIVNIDEFTNYAVAVFRTYHDKYRDDPWYEETVEQLLASSSEFEQMWGQYDIQQKKVSRVFLRVAGIDDPVGFDIHSLVDLSTSPDVHICVYTPVVESGDR